MPLADFILLNLSEVKFPLSSSSLVHVRVSLSIFPTELVTSIHSFMGTVPFIGLSKEVFKPVNTIGSPTAKPLVTSFSKAKN